MRSIEMRGDEWNAKLMLLRLRQVKTVAPADRQYSVFVGAAILASLTTFQQVCVRRRRVQDSI